MTVGLPYARYLRLIPAFVKFLQPNRSCKLKTDCNIRDGFIGRSQWGTSRRSPAHGNREYTAMVVRAFECPPKKLEVHENTSALAYAKIIG